jgi:hypothetical protein
MKYIEDVAEKIIREHNLNPKTLLVWKSRGSIPDKYFSQKPVSKTELSELQLKNQAKILKLISLPELYKKSFVSLTAYDSKITDIRKGKTNFSPIELELMNGKLDNIRSEISALLRDDRRFLDKYQEKQIDFLKREEIVVSVLLKKTGGLNDSEYVQVKGILDKRRTYLTEIYLINKLTEAIKRLYVQLQ